MNSNGNGRWKPGQSGNPAGRPRSGVPRAAVESLSELARQYTGLCVSTLVKIVKEGAERNKLVAAMALLDRGNGKPIQQIDANILQRKVNELSESELAALEARLTSGDGKSDADTPPPGAPLN